MEATQTKCGIDNCPNTFIKGSHNQKYCSPRCRRDAENISRRREPIQWSYPVNGSYATNVANTLLSDSSTEMLRKEVQRLARENEKLKFQKEEQIHAIYSAVRDGLSQLELPATFPPERDDRTRGEEVCVPVLSDLQLAKTTPTYNTQVCEERMELYGDKVIDLTNIQRSDHPVRRAHVWVLGDIIEGQGIFPGQQFLVDAGFYRQVTIHGPRILSNFLRRMLGHFEEVHVTAVIGNHGRLGGLARTEFDPESNGDRMLYRILDLMFANEPRITFNIPDGPGERNWYAIDTIGNYRSLLCHGDQFSSFGSLYAIGRKVLGWKAGAIEETWDDLFIGHFHQSTKFTFGKTVMRVNGTTESTNTYAIEKLASMGVPSQHLMFVHPEKGIVTNEYDIRLDLGE